MRSEILANARISPTSTNCDGWAFQAWKPDTTGPEQGKFLAMGSLVAKRGEKDLYSRAAVNVNVIGHVDG